MKRWVNACKGLWSLIVGLKITGIEFAKPQLTIHYPRREVDNLGSYRGHIELVPRADDPATPRCIMCGKCIETCPSGCLRLRMHVAGDPDPGSDERRELMLAPEIPLPGSHAREPLMPGEKILRVLDAFALNYNLCSLCGLCVQVCPVASLTFSRDAYLAGRSRRDFEYDLLARLRAPVDPGRRAPACRAA